MLELVECCKPLVATGLLLAATLVALYFQPGRCGFRGFWSAALPHMDGKCCAARWTGEGQCDELLLGGLLGGLPCALCSWFAFGPSSDSIDREWATAPGYCEWVFLLKFCVASCLYLLCLCLYPYLSLALRFSFFSNLRFVGLLTLHYGTADPMPVNMNPTSHRNAPPIPQTMESGATRDEGEAGTVDQRIGGSMSDRAQALATTVQVK